MNWQRMLCRVVGHKWERHSEHLEPDEPQLVHCTKCGYVSATAFERGRLMNGLGGTARLDP